MDGTYDPADDARRSYDHVTDPPYELGFMGKGWDSSGVAADWRTWGGVRIALRPGAHLLAFAGSRTYHRIATAIDDAGFEVRDQVMWIYGSGFPKSPVDLMRWLCRLVTPPGGTVLDPFMGSGSTGIGALREGFGFVGIEQSRDYFEIAAARVAEAWRAIEAEPDLVREITKATRTIAAQERLL